MNSTNRRPYRIVAIVIVTLEVAAACSDEAVIALPRAIDSADLPQATSIFGKWHPGNDPLLPQVVGWDYFSAVPQGDILSFETGQKAVNGVPQGTDAYVTSVEAYDLIDDPSEENELFLDAVDDLRGRLDGLPAKVDAVLPFELDMNEETNA